MLTSDFLTLSCIMLFGQEQKYRNSSNVSLWEIYLRFSTEGFTETHVKPNESYQRHLSLSMSCHDLITK